MVRAAAIAAALPVILLAGCGPSAAVSSPSPSGAPSPSQPPPVAGVLHPPPQRIPLPTTATLSAAGNGVWALVAGEYLYRSPDRGATWTQEPLPPGAGQREIAFTGAGDGWVLELASPETQCRAQAAGLWHSADTGRTWENLGSRGIDPARCKRGLSFSDPVHGFLGAWDQDHPPVIYRTADGGRTWTASAPLPDPPGWVTQPGGGTLQPGRVRAFGPVLLVDASGNRSGHPARYVFRSADGGATWTPLAPAGESGAAAALVSATRWIQLAPGHQSLETTDAGAGWHPYASDYSQAAPIPPEVEFGGPEVGYATVRGAIQVSVDGGGHWTSVHTPGT